VAIEHIGLSITTIPLMHHINCLGYSMELSLKPRFLPENAKKLNIPVKLWSLLHKGKVLSLIIRSLLLIWF